MPIKLQFIIICDRVEFTDQGLNFFQIADRIVSPQFPFTIEKMHLIARLHGVPNAPFTMTGDVRGGRQTQKPDSSLKGKLDHNGYAFAEVTLKGIKVPKPGIYEIGVLIDGQRIGHFQLPIEQVAH